MDPTQRFSSTPQTCYTGGQRPLPSGLGTKISALVHRIFAKIGSFFHSFFHIFSSKKVTDKTKTQTKRIPLPLKKEQEKELSSKGSQKPVTQAIIADPEATKKVEIKEELLQENTVKFVPPKTEVEPTVEIDSEEQKLLNKIDRILQEIKTTEINFYNNCIKQCSYFEGLKEKFPNQTYLATYHRILSKSTFKSFHDQLTKIIDSQENPKQRAFQLAQFLKDPIAEEYFKDLTLLTTLAKNWESTDAYRQLIVVKAKLCKDQDYSEDENPIIHPQRMTRWGILMDSLFNNVGQELDYSNQLIKAKINFSNEQVRQFERLKEFVKFNNLMRSSSGKKSDRQKSAFELFIKYRFYLKFSDIKNEIAALNSLDQLLPTNPALFENEQKDKKDLQAYFENYKDTIFSSLQEDIEKYKKNFLEKQKLLNAREQLLNLIEYMDQEPKKYKKFFRKFSRAIFTDLIDATKKAMEKKQIDTSELNTLVEQLSKVIQFAEKLELTEELGQSKKMLEEGKKKLEDVKK